MNKQRRLGTGDKPHGDDSSDDDEWPVQFKKESGDEVSSGYAQIKHGDKNFAV